MSTKLLASMRANPKADWTISDIERLCRACGILVRKSDGSHVQLKHPGARMILTIPSRRPIKAVYIRKLVSYIDSSGVQI